MPVKTEVVNIAVTLLVATGASLGWRMEMNRQDRAEEIAEAERLVRVEVTTEHIKEEIVHVRQGLARVEEYLRSQNE